MAKASINGIDIHYQSYGEGDALVFAHGAGGNMLSWWQQIPIFSQQFTCISYDQRGFGHSYDSPDGPGASAFVDDLKGLLDHLGIESAHLVAQSMGGRSMLGFAAAYPERAKSLVMADTTGGMAVDEVNQLAEQWREQNASSEPITVRALARDYQARNLNMANLYRQISATNPPRPASALTQSDSPTAEALAAMNVPTLFVVGEADEISPPHVIEVAAKYVPGARLTRVPEAGHSVYFENPDVFNFEVDRFLKSVS